MINRYSKIIYPVGFILFALIITKCNLQKVVDPIDFETRIIPGQSIEGIRLGEYHEMIEERLGPKKLHGFADGLRSWTVFTWPGTVYSGLGVYFVEMGYGEYGPADYIEVETPYDGTTYEGIGIGTHMRDVHRAWGEPELLNDNSPYSIGYTYCFEGTRFYLNFRDSLVHFIRMGPFIPYPEDSTCTEN